jgi:GTP pyrophosphokinase
MVQTSIPSPAVKPDTPAQSQVWGNRLLAGRDADTVQRIKNALRLAETAHSDQQRASGEPYISHVVAVAEILASLNLDDETVVAAILHDVVEDSELTVADIEAEFGAGVARLVDGVTKMGIIDSQVISRGHTMKEHLHAESLRKLLLAMAEDVRVVLIKLADRLHNMRTLKFLDESKQKRIARETLDIYAPLANRLGIWQIKWELEDLSFRYLDPVAYKTVATQLDERRVDREQYIEKVIHSLNDALERSGISAQVSGRPKHIYSIWKKMHRKGVAYQDLYDVRALRIIVDDVVQCYAALGVVHTLWRHVPREFDDYIATPKENMYQSIHTAVVGPEGKTLEVQIRTEAMHEHAELGVASHWRYKEGAKHDASFEQKILWLRQLLEWKDESADAGDFIDRFKSEVYQERVYVLTPDGHVLDLAQGATPLDFAYHVHTEVGHRCRGARVNARIASLTQELKSGDQVEILTTKHSAPSRDWLNPHLGYLKTSRARAKVRHWFKQQDLAQNITDGRSVLEKEVRRLGIGSLAFADLASALRFEGVDDMLAALGRGDITTAQIGHVASELLTPELPEPAELKPTRRRRSVTDVENVSVQGVGNLLTRMAQCCKPAYGDPIVGFITLGHGVTIHRRDCRNILKMDDPKRDRLIAVEWTSKTAATYPVDVMIEAIDRPGLLRDITSVLANENVNVIAVNTRSDKKHNTAQMELTVEIENVGELSRVLTRIGQLSNVYDVRRINH